MSLKVLHSLIHRELSRREGSVSYADSLSKKQEKEAKQSMKEDRIVPFRWFYPPKPMKGTSKGEAYSVDATVKIINQQWPDWKDIGLSISRKMDGVRAIILKDGSKVEVWTEDGTDITQKIPTIVAQLEKKNIDMLAAEGELEWYHEGEHMNRSLTAGMLNQKTTPEDEDEIILSLYDVMYADKDIHNESSRIRQGYVNKLKESTNVKKVKQHIVKNKPKAIEAIEKVSSQEGSEGSFVKLNSGTYPLNKENRTAIKYKNVLVFSLMVLQRNKLGESSYNYVTGTKHKGKIVYTGKTFSTSQKFEKGDVIDISAVNINSHYDESRDLLWFALWSPKILMKRDKEPDTVDTLLRAVEQTSGQEIEERAPKRVRQFMGVDQKNKIVFLGTKGEHEKGNDKHQQDSSLLVVHEGKRIIFDRGESWNWKESKPTHIILTQADSYQAYSLLHEKVDVPVFATKRVSNQMKQAFPFRRKILEENQWSNIAGLKVLPIKVPHSIKFESDGYLIKFEDKRIAYFPNVARIPDVEKVLSDVDLYIGDGDTILKDSIARKGGKEIGHLSMRSQLQLAKKHGVENVIFTSIGESGIKKGNSKVLKALKPYSKGLKVAVANDNSSFDTELKLLTDAIKAFEKKELMKTSGLYLVPPHAEKIFSGVKKYDMKSIPHKDLWDKRVWIADRDYIYGTVFVSKPIKIKREDALKPEWIDKHTYTEEEFEKFWGDYYTDEMYIYELKDPKPIDKKPWEAPEGIRVEIPKIGLMPFLTKKELTLDVNRYFIRPDESKKWPFVAQYHTRGKSVHMDIRVKIDEDSLVGYTLFVPKGLSRDPKNHSDAKKLLNKEIMPIMRKHLRDPNEKLNATLKARQPANWLTFSGYVEAGTVGATKKESGDFVIIEKGEYEKGATKSYYHEYWFWGTKGLMNGKYVMRLLENKKEWKKTDEGLFTWMFFKSNSSPYVLRQRSVDKNYHPKEGYSEVPRKYRKKIPKQYQYWKKKGKEAKELRKKLIKDLKSQIKNFVDKKRKIKFELKHQIWKGPKTKSGTYAGVIRAGPSRQRWHLLLKDGDDVRLFTTEQKIEEGKVEVTGKFQPKKAEAFDKVEDGEVDPDTIVNNTTNTWSRIKTIDEGTMKILSDDSFKRFIMKGKILKGTYVMVSKGSKQFTFKKSKKIGEKLEGNE